MKNFFTKTAPLTVSQALAQFTALVDDLSAIIQEQSDELKRNEQLMQEAQENIKRNQSEIEHANSVIEKINNITGGN